MTKLLFALALSFFFPSLNLLLWLVLALLFCLLLSIIMLPVLSFLFFLALLVLLLPLVFLLLAASLIFLAFLGLFITNVVSAISFFTTFCLDSFISICFILFSPNNCYTIFITSSPREVKCILLLLKDDYVFQRFVNPSHMLIATTLVIYYIIVNRSIRKLIKMYK